MFQIQAHESSESAIKRIGLALIDENVQMLTAPGEEMGTAVHAARKNFKRLRALLRLVRDEVGEESFQRENVCFRDAARRLAVLRDSAVIIETLDSVCALHAADLPEGAFAGIRAALVDWQQAVSRRFLQDADTLREVTAVLQQARPRFAALPIQQDGFAAFADGLRRVYKQGHRNMTAAYAAKRPELFHEWRKQVKYLWHHVELLSLLWPLPMAEMARELHELSDYLGMAHDLVVLRHMLTTPGSAYAAEADLPRLLPLLAERQTALEMAAYPLGQRLYAERPSAFVQRLSVYWHTWQESGFNGLPPQPPRLLNTQEAAARLGISLVALRRRIARGEVTAVKISGVWAIPQDTLPS
ncbi:MAG: CHAD domain-containing protein [Ardenticatenaceae bacterium]|nr:CHAD domain-containing protein [Anaerolineales bacterium]MCB8920627.1 CHAD domain-containing protein [Ardenticatenaceae bacterium]MCB8990251.1 CHAD domain-containing protein [Ardenticatenaceae bacterium]MCB9002957.1 CHAD domain-containing protein [Ardenticatenaceae bacterium]